MLKAQAIGKPNKAQSLTLTTEEGANLGQNGGSMHKSLAIFCVMCLAYIAYTVFNALKEVLK